MRIMRHVVRVNVLLMLVSGAANAATVMTTPAVYSANFEQLTCHILNLSTKEHSVKLELFDAYTGSSIYENSIMVGPGKISQVGTSSPDQRTLYCRFTVDGVPKGKLRGGIANEATGVSFQVQ